MANSLDDKWFPSITNPGNATQAMHNGACAAGLMAAVTGAINLAAIYADHPIMGTSGWGLIDAVPQSDNAEYSEFLECMRRGERKFQKAGYTLHEEYAAWLKDHRKKLALARAGEEKASSARQAYSVRPAVISG